MKKIRHLLRKYPLSVTCILCIWLLCLVPVPETPLSSVNMIDKWTHVVMFGGLTFLIWTEYGCRHRDSGPCPGSTESQCRNDACPQPNGRKPRCSTVAKTKPFLLGFIAPIMMGGAVEIVQATCTSGNRSGDFIDFIADAIGVCIGTFIGIPLALMLSKRNKDSAAN